jgi:hypothetical protein
METQTATVTDMMTRFETATLTQIMTDMVTVTDVSTVIQPTTYVSVWVKTQVIDNVCTTNFDIFPILIFDTDSNC